MGYEFEYKLDGKNYYFNIPELKITTNGKHYSGVAIIHDEHNKSFTVPLYIKYDEIDLTVSKIEEALKNKLQK